LQLLWATVRVIARGEGLGYCPFPADTGPVEAAAVHFPWRQLGELLVAEELLTEDELEQALAQQASSGRLLGQIIVGNGYLSAFSLARVLSEQHGVQLQAREEQAALEHTPATEVQPEQTWRPL